MKFKLVHGVLFALFGVSGCALNPQQISVSPTVAVHESDIGLGKSLGVLVVDERPSTSLGTRGIQGRGAALTIGPEFVPVLTKTISDALARKGFKPTDKTSETVNKLRVEIRSLEYVVTKGFWAGNLRAASSLKGICLRGDTRPFEQIYRTEKNLSVQVVQGDESNNRIVNSVLSDVIIQLIDDPNLLDCLKS